MVLHGLKQIAPYSNNSLAQSPSKLICSHAADWTGGRHLSYSRIPLPKRGSSHYAVCRKPAITLSRKDWHSAANRAVLCRFGARDALGDPAPPAAWPRWGCGGGGNDAAPTQSRIPMSKLTDTQLVILSTASRRNDRGVDLPTNVTGE